MSSILQLLGRRKSLSDLKIGAEVERFGLLGSAAGPLPQVIRYREHIRPVFDELIHRKSWKVAYASGEFVLAIERDGHQWSLEPGGQLELSAGAVKSLTELKTQEEKLEAEILSCQGARAWNWQWWGVNPYEAAEDIPLLPSPRYQIMADYFRQQGGRGWDMMRLTSGCHLNFDYFCPEHAMRLLRASSYLAPVVVAMFGNSPYFHRRRSGRLSERVEIWRHTDPLRSGIPNLFFDVGPFEAPSSKGDEAIQDYVNLVESTPLMFFYDESGLAKPANGLSFKELPAELQEANALGAIRQLFYEVRLKPCCVEIRYVDQNEPDARYAAFAFLVGLLQDEENLEQVYRESLSSNSKEVSDQIELASRVGLTYEAFVRRAEVYMTLAERALLRRRFGEESYLEVGKKILHRRMNPAQWSLAHHELTFKS